VDAITVNVLFLGPARDFAGVESCDVSLAQPATIADVKKSLADRFCALAPALSTIRFAINDEYASDSSELCDGDEVAAIPPVSGGAGEGVSAELTEGPIDATKVREFVGGDARFGGVVTFEGVTRAESDEEHGELVRLNYEAHRSMAAKTLSRLAALALKRWGPGRVAIAHRIGAVPPGEVSVMIAAAFAHRREAFEACGWLIDTLKEEVPIWKKDVFADGHIRWVDAGSSLPLEE
jgi:molybdopterin synthase catalytic subunit